MQIRPACVAELIGPGEGEVAIETQHVAGLIDRIEHAATKHGAELMQAILERRDDTEVATATAHAPEQIRVLLLARLEQSGIRRNDVHGDHVVARKAVLADQPAHAAAKGQSGDACGGDHAHRGRQAESLRLAVEFTDGKARFGLHRARGRIDTNTLHGREINHEPVVADRLACDAVTTATYGDWKVVPAGKDHTGDHIRRASTSHDYRGAPIDGPIEDDARRIVTRLAGHE